jgi:protein gp37
VLGNALDEKRIEAVLKIPAAVRGLSCEPLWSKPHLHSIDAEKIQWIIVGCDSSKHRKGWEDYEANARGIIQSGHAAGIAVYHKQMPVNGKVSLKLAEFPAEDLRVRKFPKIPVDSRAGI